MEEPRPNEAYEPSSENPLTVVWIQATQPLACLYLSSGVFPLLGYTPEELLSAPFLSFPLVPNPQDFARDFEKRVSDFLSNPSSEPRYYTDEFELIKKDGTAVWTETISNFSRNAKTGQVELHGITRDISNRVQSRRLLKEQARELACIGNLNQQFKVHRDSDSLLALSARELFNAVQPDIILIFMLQNGRLDLKCLWPESIRKNLPVIPEHCLGECLCGLAVRDHQPLYSYNIHQDPRCTWNECKLAGMSSLAALPLGDLKESIGVIAVGSAAPRNFESQAGFLETLAGQISQAVSQARLEKITQQEITARQLLESVFEESEGHYRSIIRSSPLAMHFYRLAPDGALILVDANPSADRALGIAHRPLFGQTIESAFPNLAPTEIPNLYRRVARGELGPQNFETPYQDERFSGIYQVHVFQTGPGLIAVNFSDISSLKRTENALNSRIISLTQPLNTADIALTDLFNVQDLQKIQDSFSNATGVASLITLPDGTPITQPSNFCRLCMNLIRGTSQGLKNCMVSDACIGRHNPEGPVVQRCLSGGLWDAGASITVGGKHIANWLIGQVKNEATDETCMLAYARELGIDENEFQKALDSVPVMSEDHFREIADFLFLMAAELSEKAYQNIQQARFITELKKAGEELQAKEEQLRYAQRMEAVGQLAGGIAHDFNNLLSVITGYAEFSMDLSHDAAPLRSNLSNILAATERAAWLTRQLLAFSRKQILEPKILDLNQVIEKLSVMLARVLGEHIELVTQLFPELGHVKVDPGQMEQVLLNLVVNARDAMPKGGRLILQTSNLRLDHPVSNTQADFTPGDYVLLTVQDTGVGMNEQTASKIFEPFFTTKSPDQGTGLGLATVYGIVTQSKGAITVESSPGQGTVFHLYFPRAFEETTPAPPKNQIPISAKNGETILVVEDVEAIRKYVTLILQTAGYKVLCASDGAEGAELGKTHPGKIDLLLTDVIMPKMGGTELAKQLTAFRPGLKIIFTSGYTDDTLVQQDVLSNQTGFLAKPYLKDELLEKIRKILDAEG